MRSSLPRAFFGGALGVAAWAMAIGIPASPVLWSSAEQLLGEALALARKAYLDGSPVDPSVGRGLPSVGEAPAETLREIEEVQKGSVSPQDISATMDRIARDLRLTPDEAHRARTLYAGKGAPSAPGGGGVLKRLEQGHAPTASQGEALMRRMLDDAARLSGAPTDGAVAGFTQAGAVAQRQGSAESAREEAPGREPSKGGGGLGAGAAAAPRPAAPSEAPAPADSWRRWLSDKASAYLPDSNTAAKLERLFHRMTRGPYPDGLSLPNEPAQDETGQLASWAKGEYAITPLARFKVHALVLGRKRYWFDRISNLAPIDLALGWGPMADSRILNRLKISQGQGWYHVSYSDSPPPLSDDAMIRNSANMHMIPADDGVKTALFSIRKGDVVAFEGYLVAVRANDGLQWTSSLSRTDTGSDESCEVVWTTRISIDPR